MKIRLEALLIEKDANIIINPLVHRSTSLSSRAIGVT